MSNIETLTQKVQGKLRMLHFKNDETASILEENKQKQIERHAKILEKLIEEVHEIKVEVKQQRIENGDDPRDVRAWTRDLHKQLIEYENALTEVEQQGDKLNELEIQKAKNKEHEVEEENRKKRYEEEQKFEEAKLDIRRMFEKGLEEDKSKTTN